MSIHSSTRSHISLVQMKHTFSILEPNLHESVILQNETNTNQERTIFSIQREISEDTSMVDKSSIPFVIRADMQDLSRDSHLYSSGALTKPLRVCGASPSGVLPFPVFLGTRRMDHAERPPECFMVASGGVLSEGYGHDEPRVCLGDGQTEAEGVPRWTRRRDAPVYVLTHDLT